MCHASKYPIETALSVSSFACMTPSLIFRYFQLTIRFSVASNFHKENNYSSLSSPVSTSIPHHLQMFPHTCTHSGQPCPPFKIIILDEADSMTNTAQVSKISRKEEKPTFSFCVYCRLPCVVQWKKNRKQLVSASYATTSAGQTKPFSVVMVILPAFRTYAPNTLSQHE